MADKNGRRPDGNGWNAFMQSPQAQLVLYGVVTVMCAYYAVDAVRELMNPEGSAALIEAMGQTAYYVVTVLRAVVCAATGVAFLRMALRNLRD